MQYPAFVEAKLDGEFNYIVYNKKMPFQIRTRNKYGTERHNFHELEKLFHILDGNKIEQVTLLCELFWGDGKAGMLYELLKHKKDRMVHIMPFDVYSLNGKYINNEPLVTRKEILYEILGPMQLQPKVVMDRDEAMLEYQRIVALGYEGVVVKALNSPLTLGPCLWAKLKHKDQSDYKVVDVDKTKERITIQSITTNYLTGLHLIDVGVKAPNKYKKYINIGDTITIEHQGILPSGSLRHPVLIPKKEWK